MGQGSYLIGHHLLMSTVLTLNKQQPTTCAHLVQRDPNSWLDTNGTPQQKTSLETAVSPLS